MAIPFLNNINLTAGLEVNTNEGNPGQVLSSLGTGNGLQWIDNIPPSSDSTLVYFDVKNGTGSTISKGKGVMAVGTDGNSGHILIDEMLSDGSIEPKYFLGVLEEDIDNGAFARVVSFGIISQFDTGGQNGETWADGQILWCDPNSPGDFTITEPDGPNVKIAAAIILNSSTNGKIQVRVQANEGVHNLRDTKITSQVDGDVLVWNDTDGVWFNDSTLNIDYTEGRVGIGTTSPARKLEVYNSSSGIVSQFRSGSGTSSFICFANTASTADQVRIGSVSSDLVLSTSYTERMRIDSSGNVGIGTTAPIAKLDVNGDTRSTGFQVNSGGKYKIGNLSQYITGYNDTAIDIVTGGTVSLRVADNGNVGIGTTTPSTSLEVSGRISQIDLGESLFVGYNAGIVDDSTTNRNTALGYQSFVYNTSGSNNVGVGYRSLLFNTTGTNNVAAGNEAMRNNTTGSYNVAYGNNSLRLNTVGGFNLGFGVNALYSNTTGSFNIANGNNTLFANTTGGNNTGFGYEALRNKTTGSDNVALGYYAGKFLSDGATALTDSSNSIFIGSLSRASVDNSDNEIVIGYNAIGNGSDTITLGNKDITKTITSGDLSIGTDSPAGRLDVVSLTKTSLPFPRMTSAQRTAIASPPIGGHVYQTDATEGVYVYKSTGWVLAY